jgi:hypothetical protein
MIENFLIAGGLGCGNKDNFKKVVYESMQLHLDPKWYFRTPVGYTSDGLKSASLDLAFPFLALIDDSKERIEAVEARIGAVREEYVDDLVKFLRQFFIVPPDEIKSKIIPFWFGEPGYSEETEDFNGIRIHIINVVLTVKYRNLELPTSLDAVLLALQAEQSELEKKIDNLTIYVTGADFAELSQTDQNLLTAQLTGMNTYNDALKQRILNY